MAELKLRLLAVLSEVLQPVLVVFCTVVSWLCAFSGFVLQCMLKLSIQNYHSHICLNSYSSLAVTVKSQHKHTTSIEFLGDR